jgi:hypothetical protein
VCSGWGAKEVTDRAASLSGRGQCYALRGSGKDGVTGGVDALLGVTRMIDSIGVRDDDNARRGHDRRFALKWENGWLLLLASEKNHELE